MTKEQKVQQQQRKEQIAGALKRGWRVTAGFVDRIDFLSAETFEVLLIESHSNQQEIFRWLAEVEDPEWVIDWLSNLSNQDQDGAALEAVYKAEWFIDVVSHLETRASGDQINDFAELNPPLNLNQINGLVERAIIVGDCEDCRGFIASIGHQLSEEHLLALTNLYSKTVHVGNWIDALQVFGGRKAIMKLAEISEGRAPAYCVTDFVRGSSDDTLEASIELLKKKLVPNSSALRKKPEPRVRVNKPKSRPKKAKSPIAVKKKSKK